MAVVKKELKNGLILAAETMPWVRSVSIGVWLGFGSRHESDSVAGISHFIEHLLFKGTQSRSAADIAKAIDSVGGQLNAFTDKEYVGFYAKVIDKHLALALELLSDIVRNPSFPENEFERERNVIFEEISMIEDSPQDLVQDLFMENFWRGHPLGRPVSGTRESVARIMRPQVVWFFRQYYTSRNMIVSVAGNIRQREVAALIDRYFSDLHPGDVIDARNPPVACPSRVVRRKPSLEQTHICLGASCPPMDSKQRYCTYVLSSVLGGSMSSRLFQNIREKRGLVYSIYSTPNLYHDAGNLMVYAAAASRKAVEVVELTLQEFRRLRKRLVPDEELTRAKESVKGSIMLSLESPSSRMTNLAQQLIYFGRFYSLREILRGFDRVRADDVRELANEIFGSLTVALIALANRSGKDLKSVAMKV